MEEIQLGCLFTFNARLSNSISHKVDAEKVPGTRINMDERIVCYVFSFPLENNCEAEVTWKWEDVVHLIESKNSIKVIIPSV